MYQKKNNPFAVFDKRRETYLHTYSKTWFTHSRTLEGRKLYKTKEQAQAIADKLNERFSNFEKPPMFVAVSTRAARK